MTMPIYAAAFAVALAVWSAGLAVTVVRRFREVTR